MRRIFTVFVLALLCFPLLWAETDFAAILKDVDSLSDFGNKDYTAIYAITTEKPDEKPVNMEIKLFRRDVQDQFVISIRKPKEQKGQGYLKKGDTIFFYDPSSGEIVPTTSLKNVGDSSAQNRDFEKYTYSDDYRIASTSESQIGKYPVWVIDLTGATSKVPYQHVKLFVRKDNHIPLMEEDYAVSGGLLRTVKFAPTYIKIADKLVPAKFKIEDNFNKGEQSLLEILDITLTKLSDSIFTPEFLKMAQ